MVPPYHQSRLLAPVSLANEKPSVHLLAWKLNVSVSQRENKVDAFSVIQYGGAGEDKRSYDLPISEHLTHDSVIFYESGKWAISHVQCSCVGLIKKTESLSEFMGTGWVFESVQVAIIKVLQMEWQLETAEVYCTQFGSWEVQDEGASRYGS